MSYNWTPWRFKDNALEYEYAADRALSWSRMDKAVALPWLLFWVCLLKKVWLAVSTLTVLLSACCLLVTISPFYLQPLLGTRRYIQHRLLIVTCAKVAYLMHPGGGLYREGLVLETIPTLGGASMLVRLAVGSRTLFWLILAFGYPLPPHLRLTLDALQLGLLMRLKPSQPVCAVMQSAASAPLFRSFAAGLPLLSLVPLARPLLVEGADVCNPLIAWMQVGLGYLLPLLAGISSDIVARRRFAARRKAVLCAEDAARWLPSKAVNACCPWTISALAYPHMLSALWYLLMWRQLELAQGGKQPALAVAAGTVS